MRKNNCDTHYFIDEVCQQWITADNKETVIAKAMNMESRGWVHTTDMSIKQSGNIYYSHSYDIDGYVYPKVKLLPILRRNGLRTSFHGVTPGMLIRALLGESKYAEMLLKTKQYGMLELYMYRGGLSIRGRSIYAIVTDTSSRTVRCMTIICVYLIISIWIPITLTMYARRT